MDLTLFSSIKNYKINIDYIKVVHEFYINVRNVIYKYDNTIV